MTALRDAIAGALWDQRDCFNAAVQADEILALPLMAAHLRVVEAARAFKGAKWNRRAAKQAELCAAVADLDALEGR